MGGPISWHSKSYGTERMAEATATQKAFLIRLILKEMDLIVLNRKISRITIVSLITQVIIKNPKILTIGMIL